MPDFKDTITQNHIAELRKRGEEKLMQAMASQYGYTYINLHGYTINPEAVMRIPEGAARENKMVAFELKNKILCTFL